MKNHYTYHFGTICERDIDTLLLTSFALDADFLGLFTSKIPGRSFPPARVIGVELNKTHPVYGESDVTVIMESEGVRYGLLIEDKVGAEAQPRQCERYYQRGELGVKEGDYAAYYVFICAAKEYLETNDEARKYMHSVSFEELAEYFAARPDRLSRMHYEEIQQAMTFAKTPYKKNVDAAATAFWKQYVQYATANYPDLQLLNGSPEKSRGGDWPKYYTQLNLNNKVYIQHKMDKGIIDLTFGGMADRQTELADFLHTQIGDYEAMGFGILPANKSAVLRKDFGKDRALSFRQPFESQIDNIKLHFEALNELHLIAAKLNRDSVKKLYE